MNPSNRSDEELNGQPESAADDLLDLNGIDAHWLTAELSRAGFDGAVDRLDAALVGTGQVGENVRCILHWADGDDPSERPRSVVIKLASTNETSRAAAAATRTYIREVGFYRDLARSVAIRIPAVYHVSEDRDANRFILVMEDIAPAEAGDQLDGCSLERAELAVDAAADLHGSTWDRSILGELDWLDQPTPQSAADRVALFDALHPRFVESYQSMLSDEQLRFGEWLAPNFGRWLAAQPAGRCLVHGDFRLDNMLFGTGTGAPALTTVDWQTPGFGGGLSDVAYFLSGSLDRAQCRDHEQRLLERYRSRLVGHGVELPTEQILRDYRAAAPAGYVMAVIASQLVGRTDRGDQMFMVMAAGSAAMAMDLDTKALVD
jgi:hypothetical protein